MEQMQTILENVAPDWRQLAEGAESLYAHMEDCAILLLRGRTEPLTPTFFLEEDLVQDYRALRRQLRTAPSEGAQGTGRAVETTGRGLHALCGAMLCRAMLARVAKETALDEGAVFAGQEESEVILSQNRNRVVLLPNAMSATALERFRRVLPDLAGSTCSDASEVCDEVYAGRAKYAILPIESSTDGVLKRFAAIVDRYELKTVLTCSVQDAEREQFTRFALLARGMETIDCGRQGAERFFSCNIYMTDPTHLFDVLAAADYFGLRAVRVDSVPLAHNSTGCTFTLVFLRAQGDDVIGFYCYLSLEQAGFLPSGNYTQLK